MPEVSNFLGISIHMYFDDHNPPHFHARYGEYEGIFLISTLCQKEGNLPPRIIGLVTEWAELHKQELLDNWNSLSKTGTYVKIKPLI